MLCVGACMNTACCCYLCELDECSHWLDVSIFMRSFVLFGSVDM